MDPPKKTLANSEEIETASVSVKKPVGVPFELAVAVGESDRVGDGELLTECECERVASGVRLGSGDCVGVGQGDCERVGQGLGVGDRARVGHGDSEAVTVSVSVRAGHKYVLIAMSQ
jgi:hypothetical protein